VIAIDFRPTPTVTTRPSGGSSRSRTLCHWNPCRAAVRSTVIVASPIRPYRLLGVFHAGVIRDFAVCRDEVVQRRCVDVTFAQNAAVVGQLVADDLEVVRRHRRGGI
jgi:hypothetical protein